MTKVMQINRWINTHLQTMFKIWVVVFTALTLFLLFANRQRAIDNKHRIADINALLYSIQKSRVESCKQNYQTLIDAVQPFGKKDDPRTPENEVNATQQFIKHLKEKKLHCVKQVSPRRINEDSRTNKPSH